MTSPSRYAASRGLLARARRVIPGGHHLSGRPFLDEETSPLYFTRGAGCRIWDADGHEYIDYLMGYGALLLGYAHEEVNARVALQAAQGNLLSLNHPLHVAFIEELLRRFPAADRGIFFRTGSEATTAALRIARRHTGRQGVARCGYHGWHDWCLAGEPSVPTFGEQVLSFDARSPESLEELLDKHGSSIAAVIVAPEMIHPPDRHRLLALQELTGRAGAVFVLDEVKTAFRAPSGSMQQLFGLEPDITTLSKGLSNGWPAAALVGKAAVLRAAEGLHLSATYHGETASLAAALATLHVLERDSVPEHVDSLGRTLIDGLNEAARDHGIAARAYGEPLPCMPFLAFEEPAGVRDTFFRELLARGVLLHPRHMGFLSAAHTEADVAQTVDAARDAFRCARAEKEKGDALQRAGA